MAITEFDTRTEIETPECVLLTYHLAGPGSRMAAYLIDLLIRITIVWLLSWAISYMVPFFGMGVPFGVLLIVIFLLEWGYSAVFEGFWNGQTPGKKILGLRVIKDAGHPISFYDSTLRNFLRAADILPFGYGVGLISMTATKKLQRIGDLVAGTIVVRIEINRFQRDMSAFNRLEPITPSECTGRYFVSERTLDVVEQLIWRRGNLTRRRNEEIAAILAKPLARQMGYALEEDEGVNRNLYFLRRILRTFSTIHEGEH